MADSSNIFVLEVIGGLCNRLRAIFSYLPYARSIGKSLLVYWKNDHKCPTNPFGNVIITPPDVLFTDIKPSLIDVATYDSTEHLDFRLLKPTDDILKSARMFIKDIFGSSDDFIAVHIRRTDFTFDHYGKESYTDDSVFIDFIDSHPDKKVFLATDDPRVQFIYANLYGSRLYTVQLLDIPLGERFSTTEQAFFEILIASMASKFVGTKMSSFSELIQTFRDLYPLN